MNILFFDMGSYTYRDTVNAITSLGHSVSTLYYHFSNRYNDGFFSERFSQKINDGNFDVVFSINFFPLVASICSEFSVPYVSWCYDSPLSEQLSSYFSFDTNIIFLFDRQEVQYYNSKGFNNILHMPLAVNTARIDEKLKLIPENYYSSDISFVGSLYSSPLDSIMLPADDYSKGYVEALFQTQFDVYGCNLIQSSISEDLIERINDSYKAIGQNSYKINTVGLEYAIFTKITNQERTFLLNELSKLYDVHLYTTDSCSLYRAVHVHGPVKYNTEMNAVFRDSILNLCPTLRSIVSGIPLRSLDVLAAGGTLFSNYQPELFDYFTEGVEIITYSSIEEAFEKTEYYINHPEVCKKIATAGKQAVAKSFSYGDRINTMLSFV